MKKRAMAALFILTILIGASFLKVESESNQEASRGATGFNVKEEPLSTIASRGATGF
ncbi:MULTISPECIES: hypothetical protein [Bacillus]|uniref:hypothetical protein n=1 Tax=Bacillus TaxID=1386 RepID=UPI001C23E645|nr:MULTISPECIES: hypothetical protein [Bacillus]MBU8855282.1 hypothetical protein [Bacillus sp. FJAT-26377]MCY7454284.1 hypothetical protein [Bacillus altitudinis]MED1461448.1 hypothetical protein [Bacillus safensis]